MLSQIGNFCISSGIAILCFTLLYCLCKKNIHTLLVRYLFIAHAIFISTAFSILVLCFCVSDFSVKNVFLNSSAQMPLIFKISGSWASHNGSILLWYSMLSISACICVFYSKCVHIRASALINLFILIFIGVIIYLTSNPFTKIATRAIIHQGVGLNPLLQDAALSVHPPILYMGYVAYIIPFVYSCLALIYTSDAQVYMSFCMNFSRFGMTSLVAGVSLGSWWAYRELGWGGFWFFDPVENLSLIPLICAIAFHHSLLFVKKKSFLITWSVFFGITIFPITIIATFLVRSGLLISVHAFSANDSKILYLLICAVIIFFSSVTLFLLRVSHIKISNRFLSYKEQGIYYANITWLIAISTLIFAILYPIIIKSYGAELSIDAEYYYITFIPSILPTIILAGSFAYLKRDNNKLWHYLVSLLIAIIASVIFYRKNTDANWDLRYLAITIITLSSGVFLLSSSVIKLIEKSAIFSMPLSRGMMSMLIGHTGYALMIVSISLNTLMKQEFDFIGSKGSSMIYDGYNVTLNNITYSKSDNYYRQIVELWVVNDNNETIILRPEYRFYEIENAITSESDIYSSIGYDLYAVISNIENDMIYVKIYYRPYMWILWLSLILISASIVISFNPHNRLQINQV